MSAGEYQYKVASVSIGILRLTSHHVADLYDVIGVYIQFAYSLASWKFGVKMSWFSDFTEQLRIPAPNTADWSL